MRAERTVLLIVAALVAFPAPRMPQAADKALPRSSSVPSPVERSLALSRKIAEARGNRTLADRCRSLSRQGRIHGNAHPSFRLRPDRNIDENRR